TDDARRSPTPRTPRKQRKLSPRRFPARMTGAIQSFVPGSQHAHDAPPSSPPSLLLRWMRSSMSERPPTKGRRLLRLATMTAKVTSQYAGARLKAAFQDRDTAQQ